MDQLEPEIRSAVFGNVGSIIAFRVGNTDAEILEREFGHEYTADRFTDFYITSNWADAHDAANHIYFDEIEIYSDTGTGATGLMSDATISSGSGGQTSSGSGGQTAPNAPQNAQVVVTP